jgi:hypothetical protein
VAGARTEEDDMAATGVLGLWRLESYYDLDDTGNRSTGPLGTAPRGLLYYGADGYMSVNMMRTEPAEAAAPYMGYAGRWRLDGGRLIHQISVCSNPAWAGTEQVREMELDGDRLTLVGTALIAGKPQRRLLNWRRA